MEVKWLCVVNLSGIHGPMKMTGDGCGRYWDKSGGWDCGKKSEMKDGCWRYVFDKKGDAEIWVQGAQAVSKAMRRFLDSGRG